MFETLEELARLVGQSLARRWLLSRAAAAPPTCPNQPTPGRGCDDAAGDDTATHANQTDDASKWTGLGSRDLSVNCRVSSAGA